MPQSHPRLKHPTGFTLIELIVTLIVASILMLVVMPSFKGLLSRSNLSTTHNDLLATLHYTRAEASTRGTNITLTRSGSAWNQGWEVKTSGTILRQHGGLASNYKIETKPANTSTITFDSRGTSDKSVCFTLSDTDGYSGSLYIKTLTSGATFSAKDCQD